MIKRVIVGAGEVGRGLNEVIGGILHDPAQGMYVNKCVVEELHICFPYGPGFEKAVVEYKEHFSPRFTIIHSTVPVGTSLKLGAVHSPIRGTHPKLAEGIRTFVKYVGGPEMTALEVARRFRECGMEVHIAKSAAETELLKLLDTTQYGFMILVNRYCAEQAAKYGVSFETVYTHANQTYNAGYAELGRPEVGRPVLRYQPGPIGGHCVRENAALLDAAVALLFNASR